MTADVFDGFFCFSGVVELVLVKGMLMSAGFIWIFVCVCADSVLNALISPDTFFMHTHT